MDRKLYLLILMVILFIVASGCLGTTTEKKVSEKVTNINVPEAKASEKLASISVPEAKVSENFTNISVQEAKLMIGSGDVFILDVRPQDIYEATGHIKGATIIPAKTLETRLNEIPKDKNILVYCKTGKNSPVASKILENNGFKKVYNMNGGLDEWMKSGFEVDSKLTKAIADKTYKSWQMWPGKAELYAGKEPHGALHTTYVNDIALSAIKGKNGTFPTGSMIVKEGYDADKKLIAIISLTKVMGYDSEHHDWFWIRVIDGNISAQGKVQGCITCHSANYSNDYIYTSSLR